ncbi:MAG: ABC-2 family transporter protein [Candidatus Sungbacteria bacterium]|nr:ABC-2 family transporter protein [Candidatus Sungbacteria bacterium]
MAVKTIIKYLKIYRVVWKYSIIERATYPAEFLTGLIVECGYIGIFVLFFTVLFGHITEIAGWNYYEMLFLAGINLINGGLYWSMLFASGLMRLPEDIKNGNVDIALLKPINPLFTLTLSKPYFTSILSVIPGVYIIYYALAQLHRMPSLLDILFGSVLFCCGMVIAYAIAVMLSSLSFYFLNASAFPEIAARGIDFYTRSPHSVYTGALRIVLFFIIPVVFISSIPSSTVLRGVEFQYLFLGIGLAAAFLCMAILVWNRMIRYYSSASS